MTRTVTDNAELRLERVRALVRASVPATSVYVSGSAPGAGERDLPLRWDALRATLADAGAPTEDLDVVGALVAATPSGDHATAALVADGQVFLHVTLENYDGPDIARFGRWPRAVPLLRWQQRRGPAVAAVVGHGTAEIRAYDADGHLVVEEQLVGGDDEIERNAPGGWAQPRYRRRAEDSWDHNAHQFAAAIAQLAAHMHPLVVLLAGDGREVVSVRHRLPTELHGLTVDVTSRPAPDGEVHVPYDTVRTEVLAAARRRCLGQLHSFDEAVRDRLAVEGQADVVHALDQGRVARLVIVDRIVADELADAVVAAALDAETELTIAEPTDITLVGGLGAVLRY